MMFIKGLIRRHKRASLIGVAALTALGGLLVPAINAPTSFAASHHHPLTTTTQHTVIGNAHIAMAGPNTDLAIVLGHDFPVQALTVTVVAGNQMRQAHVTPETDGRISIVTFLPSGYTGSVRAIVQYGSMTTVIDNSPDTAGTTTT